MYLESDNLLAWPYLPIMGYEMVLVMVDIEVFFLEEHLLISCPAIIACLI